MGRDASALSGRGAGRGRGRTVVRVASGVSAQAAAFAVGTPAPVAIVSAIIPVLRDDAAVADLHRAYQTALRGEGRQIEFIYVLARQSKQALDALSALKRAGEPLTVIVLSRWDGEGAALRSAFQRARGETVLILSASLQVEPGDVPKVLAALEDSDMAVATRRALDHSWFAAAQTRLFQWLVRLLFGRTINDPVCRVRAYRREVLDEIAGYSVQQHFSPLLAAERGFRVAEVEVAPAQGAGRRARAARFSLLSRLRLALEAISLFVVLKFVHKPLRFFAMVGVPILLVGVVYTGILAIERLFFGEGLADRPALVLAVLLVVLGIQVLALGLIGEIIIFVSGKRIKDYTIEKII
jgi:glycosyltransferase involved in cell wall biosynthesis